MLIQPEFRTAPHNAKADRRFEAELVSNAQPSAVSLYAAGSTIYAQGDATGHLFIVEFGAVRVCRVTSDGRRQISAFHFAGEVFGFEAGQHRHFSAEAVDSVGIRVLRPTLDGSYAQTVLPLALESLTRAQEHLLLLGRKSGEEKVAAFLLDMAERQGTFTWVELSMQRHDIADYLGLSFETVSRILTRMKTARLVRLPHVKRIELLDVAKLEALCD
jgi:CRP/FNR family nitrogen fixation transcriptional regulator